MNSLLPLKRGIVLFWALWTSLVFGSNLGDGLEALGALPAGFPFASGNLDHVTGVTQVFGLPALLAAALFAGVVVWDAVNVCLLWWAVRRSRRMEVGDFAAINLAFSVALGLWGTLMVADEVFLSYRVAGFEQTHRGIFTAMLVSFLAVRLLPGE